MDIPKVVVRLAEKASLRGKTAFARESVRPVYEFLGVPYALAPVGEGRFQPPRPLQLWEGEREAKKFGPMCPQNIEHFLADFLIPPPRPTNISEDCLYLNVFTPTLRRQAGLPVMVYLHGGAFTYGSADMYRGTPICSYHDVVMVSLNYRVGPFGFLTTGDSIAPGNYGLLDQIEALQWVQKYIREFGGDPDNVTIYGESAGGISVSMLMMSDLSRGLFRRAISQSGTANMPGVLNTHKEAGSHVRNQLEAAGVKLNNSEDIIRYLKSLSSDDLMKIMGDRFRPVVDGHVLHDFLAQRYRMRGGVRNTEYLIGCNTHEGYRYLLMDVNGAEIKDRQAAFKVIVNIAQARGAISVQDEKKAEEFGKLVMGVYLRGVKDGDAEGLLRGLADFYGDAMFAIANEEAARLHCGLNKTYFYQFTHRPSYAQYHSWVGSDHGDDVPFVMGLPQAKVRLPFTDAERRLSKIMMCYWVNFARTGSPNGPGLPQWPLYTLPQRHHLALNSQPTTGSQLRADREKFWREEAQPFMTRGPVSKY